MRIDNRPPPPPMPDIGPARVHLTDLRNALSRADEAWNTTQMRDALRSLRFFLSRMEFSLPTKDEAAALPVLHDAVGGFTVGDTRTSPPDGYQQVEVVVSHPIVCQRCGHEGPDRRTLWMRCLYEMAELGIPFVKRVVAEDQAFYTLTVCKECRADWLSAVKTWFDREHE